MKNILKNEIVVLLARILLGGLFILSGLDKILDPSAFAVSILNYKIIGPEFAMLIATILPPLELLCGSCLIIGLYPRTSALLITTMLCVFTILIITSIIRGLDISCGCFSQDPETGKIGLKKIIENLGMILLGIYLLSLRSIGYSLVDLIDKGSEKKG